MHVRQSDTNDSDAYASSFGGEALFIRQQRQGLVDDAEAVIDYSGQTFPTLSVGQVVVEQSGLIDGWYKPGGEDQVSFSGATEVRFLASDTNDDIRAYILGLAPSNVVAVDGGGGFDHLQLMFSHNKAAYNDGFAITHKDGTLVTNWGTFSNFEQLLVLGGLGNDKIRAGSGDDTIIGYNGSDHLAGGAGNDIIEGGHGRDTLGGGLGADVFVFKGQKDSDPGRSDVINDFSHIDQDKIDLRHFDADVLIAGRQHLKFIDQSPFTGPGGADGELRQQLNDDGTVTLQADTNHDGIPDFAVLVYAPAPLVVSDLLF